MKIETIKDALGATVLEGEKGLGLSVEHVYASDLMSDVLAFGKPDSILLTGLATLIDAMPAESIRRPLLEFYAPRLEAGEFADSLATVLGLPSAAGAALGRQNPHLGKGFYMIIHLGMGFT